MTPQFLVLLRMALRATARGRGHHGQRRRRGSGGEAGREQGSSALDGLDAFARLVTVAPHDRGVEEDEDEACREGFRDGHPRRCVDVRLDRLEEFAAPRGKSLSACVQHGRAHVKEVRAHGREEREVDGREVDEVALARANHHVVDALLLLLVVEEMVEHSRRRRPTLASGPVDRVGILGGRAVAINGTTRDERGADGQEHV